MLMEDSAKAIAIAIMGGRRRRVAVIVMVARRRGWVGLLLLLLLQLQRDCRCKMLRNIVNGGKNSGAK